jgi:preprotein translocase subunit SecA
VGLRSYGQKDPLVEYKNEAYKMFETLMGNIEQEVLNNLFRAPEGLQRWEQFLFAAAQNLIHGGAAEAAGSGTSTVSSGGGGAPAGGAREGLKLVIPPRKKAAAVAAAQFEGVGRNDPCPCGSGKKYKACHGRTA